MTSDRPPDLYESVGTRGYWDALFSSPDPFDYTNDYERSKYLQTLSLVPEKVTKALELACAEGHFTSMLAARVPEIIATDISVVALGRAMERCKSRSSVSFQYLNFVEEPLPGKFDLIVCSEVLYYLGNVERLRLVAQKMVDALETGGAILMAHANLVSDNPGDTGFDWADHSFGAQTIGEVFSTLGNLQLARELRTPLYRIQLFQKVDPTATASTKPDIVLLPLEVQLPSKVERSVIWNGAVTRRIDAIRTERVSQIPILMYHRVANDGPPGLAPYRTDPRSFEEQLQWLRRNGYYSISLEDWLIALDQRQPLRGRPLMITFDDAYRDFATTAWPILRRYDFGATVFVVTDHVGGVADWDRSYGEPAPLMDWDTIVNLSQTGVAFGSHTATHRRLTELQAGEVTTEIVKSKCQLEAKIHNRVLAISYPWGDTSESIRQICSSNNYSLGLTTLPGFSSIEDHKMALPRVEIFGSDDMVRFSSKLKHDNCG